VSFVVAADAITELLIVEGGGTIITGVLPMYHAVKIFHGLISGCRWSSS
jgi:hypothetical protein